MSKCYGLIRVYDEYGVDVTESNIILPNYVSVHSIHDNYLRLAKDVLVVSDRPIEGVTDYVTTGSSPMMVDYTVEDGKVIVRA